jgi:hypothetical protein
MPVGAVALLSVAWFTLGTLTGVTLSKATRDALMIAGGIAGAVYLSRK